jgi:hypothetical protein
MGLFDTPDQIRQAQQAQLMQQYRAGDMVGAAAAGLGNKLTKAAGYGLFDIDPRSKEEIQAQKLQSMMQGLDMGDNASIESHMNKLNKAGFQPQAMQLAGLLRTPTKPGAQWSMLRNPAAGQGEDPYLWTRKIRSEDGKNTTVVSGYWKRNATDGQQNWIPLGSAKDAAEHVVSDSQNPDALVPFRNIKVSDDGRNSMSAILENYRDDQTSIFMPDFLDPKGEWKMADFMGEVQRLAQEQFDANRKLQWEGKLSRKDVDHGDSHYLRNALDKVLESGEWDHMLQPEYRMTNRGADTIIQTAAKRRRQEAEVRDNIAPWAPATGKDAANFRIGSRDMTQEQMDAVFGGWHEGLDDTEMVKRIESIGKKLDPESAQFHFDRWDLMRSNAPETAQMLAGLSGNHQVLKSSVDKKIKAARKSGLWQKALELQLILKYLSQWSGNPGTTTLNLQGRGRGPIASPVVSDE